MATDKVDRGETSLTDRQLAKRLKEMFGQLAEGTLNGDHIQALNEHRDPFASLKAPDTGVDNYVEWWHYHFKTLYRINPDFSGLIIPEKVVGFDRLVIIPKGLTHWKWVETARTIHEVDYEYYDLDATVTENDRSPKDRSYGIWIRDRQEADEETENTSAYDISRLTPKVDGIVLLERLVAGTGYLFDEMRHMDCVNWTSCSGSRDLDEKVPLVRWNSSTRKVYIRKCNSRNCQSNFRIRAVVS